jgi:uridine kinase
MHQPYIIGISGGSGSGKTYFMNHLLHAFDEKDLCVISQDNYYRPRHQQKADENGVINFDLPESIDYEQYMQDILDLKNGHIVEREEYTFNNPDKKPRVLVFEPRPIIVVEGLFVFFFKEIADLLDLKIFIDAQTHVRIRRRIIRDNQERGYDLHDVLYRYENHVMPSFERFIEPHKFEADFIIPNNRHFLKALEVIISHLKAKIAETV